MHDGAHGCRGELPGLRRLGEQRGGIAYLSRGGTGSQLIPRDEMERAVTEHPLFDSGKGGFWLLQQGNRPPAIVDPAVIGKPQEGRDPFSQRRMRVVWRGGKFGGIGPQRSQLFLPARSSPQLVEAREQREGALPLPGSHQNEIVKEELPGGSQPAKLA